MALLHPLGELPLDALLTRLPVQGLPANDLEQSLALRGCLASSQGGFRYGYTPSSELGMHPLSLVPNLDTNSVRVSGGFKAVATQIT